MVIVQLEELDKLKKIHLIWTRTRDLPACSIVPQPTTLPTRVEAGSNTSTVTLRVVRGDEMGLKKAAP
jgi:hypothetical protein